MADLKDLGQTNVSKDNSTNMQKIDISQIGNFDSNTSLEDIAGINRDIANQYGEIAENAAQNVANLQQARVGNDFGGTNPYMYNTYYQPAVNSFKSDMRVEGTNNALQEGMKRGQAAAEAALENAKNNYSNSLDAYNNAKEAFAHLKVAQLDTSKLPNGVTNEDVFNYRKMSEYQNKEAAVNDITHNYIDAQGINWNYENMWSDVVNSIMSSYGISQGQYDSWSDEERQAFWDRSDVSRSFNNEYAYRYIGAVAGEEAQRQYKDSYDYLSSLAADVFDYVDGVIDKLPQDIKTDIFALSTQENEAKKELSEFLNTSSDKLAGGVDKYGDTWIDENIPEEYREELKKEHIKAQNASEQAEGTNVVFSGQKAQYEEDAKKKWISYYDHLKQVLNDNGGSDPLADFIYAGTTETQEASKLIESVYGFDLTDLKNITQWRKEAPDEFNSYAEQVAQAMAQTSTIEVADGERWYYTGVAENGGYEQLKAGTPVFFAYQGSYDENGKMMPRLEKFVNAWNDYYSADVDSISDEELSSKQDALNEAYLDYMTDVSIALRFETELGLPVNAEMFRAAVACRDGVANSDYMIGDKKISDFIAEFSATAKKDKQLAYQQFLEIVNKAVSNVGEFYRYDSLKNAIVKESTYFEAENVKDNKKLAYSGNVAGNKVLNNAGYKNIDTQEAAALYVVLMQSMEDFNNGATDKNIDPKFMKDSAFNSMLTNFANNFAQSREFTEVLLKACTVGLFNGNFLDVELDNKPGSSVRNIYGSIFSGDRKISINNIYDKYLYYNALEDRRREMAASLINPLLVSTITGDKEISDIRGVGNKFTTEGKGMFGNWHSFSKRGLSMVANIGEMALEAVAMQGLTAAGASLGSKILNSKLVSGWADNIALALLPNSVNHADDLSIAAGLASSTWADDIARGAAERTAFVSSLDDVVRDGVLSLDDTSKIFTIAEILENNGDDVVRGVAAAGTAKFGAISAATANALSSLASDDLANVLKNFSNFAVYADDLVNSTKYGKVLGEIGEIVLSTGEKVSASQAAIAVAANRAVGSATISLVTGIPNSAITQLPQAAQNTILKAINLATEGSVMNSKARTMSGFLMSLGPDDMAELTNRMLSRQATLASIGGEWTAMDTLRALGDLGWDNAGKVALWRDFLKDAATDPLRDLRRNIMNAQMDEEGNFKVQTAKEYFTDPETYVSNLGWSIGQFGLSRVFNEVASAVYGNMAKNAFNALETTGASVDLSAERQLKRAIRLQQQAMKYSDKAWQKGASYRSVVSNTKLSEEAIEKSFKEICKNNGWDYEIGEVKEHFDNFDQLSKYLNKNNIPTKEAAFNMANGLGLRAANNYNLFTMKIGTRPDELGGVGNDVSVAVLKKIVDTMEENYDDIMATNQSGIQKRIAMSNIAKGAVLDANNAGEFGIKIRNLDKSLDAVFDFLNSTMEGGLKDGTLKSLKVDYMPMKSLLYAGSFDDMKASHADPVMRGVMLENNYIDVTAADPKSSRDIKLKDIVDAMANGDSEFNVYDDKGNIAKTYLLDYDGANFIDMLTTYSNNYNLHKYLDPLFGQNLNNFGVSGLKNGKILYSGSDIIDSIRERDLKALKKKMEAKQKDVLDRAIASGYIDKKEAENIKKTGFMSTNISEKTKSKLEALKKELADSKAQYDEAASKYNNIDQPESIYAIVSDMFSRPGSNDGMNINIGKEIWQKGVTLSDRLYNAYINGDITKDMVNSRYEYAIKYGKNGKAHKEILITQELLEQLDIAAKHAGKYPSDLVILSAIYNDTAVPYLSKKALKDGSFKYEYDKDYVPMLVKHYSGKYYRPTISTFTKDNAFLSNSFKSDVTYNGVKYLNAEAAYQAQKMGYLNTPADTKLDFTKMTGEEARKATSGLDINTKAWNRNKVKVMNEVVRAKFENPDLMKLLTDTEGSKIADWTHDGNSFWGVNRETKYGKNMLGKILESVRDGSGFVTEEKIPDTPFTRALDSYKKDVMVFGDKKMETAGLMDVRYSVQREGTGAYQKDTIGDNNRIVTNTKPIEDAARTQIDKSLMSGNNVGKAFVKRYSDFLIARAKTELSDLEDPFYGSEFLWKIDEIAGDKTLLTKYFTPYEGVNKSLASSMVTLQRDRAIQAFKDHLNNLYIEIQAGKYDEMLPDGVSRELLAAKVDNTYRLIDSATGYDNLVIKEADMPAARGGEGNSDPDEILDFQSSREAPKYDINGNRIDDTRSGTNDIGEIGISGRDAEREKDVVSRWVDDAKYIMRAFEVNSDPLHSIVKNDDIIKRKNTRIYVAEKIKGSKKEAGLSDEIIKLVDEAYGTNEEIKKLVDNAQHSVNIRAKKYDDKNLKKYYKLEALGIAAPESGIDRTGAGSYGQSSTRYFAAKTAADTGVNDTFNAAGWENDIFQARMEAGRSTWHQLNQMIDGVTKLKDIVTKGLDGKKLADASKKYDDLISRITQLRDALPDYMREEMSDITDNFENSLMSMFADVRDSKSAIKPTGDIVINFNRARTNLKNVVSKLTPLDTGNYPALKNDDTMAALLQDVVDRTGRIKKLTQQRKIIESYNYADQTKDLVAVEKDLQVELKALRDSVSFDLKNGEEFLQSVVKNRDALVKAVGQYNNAVQEIKDNLESFRHAILPTSMTNGKESLFTVDQMMYIPPQEEKGAYIFNDIEVPVGDDSNKRTIAFRETYQISGNEYVNTSNIGITLEPYDVDTGETLDMEDVFTGETGKQLSEAFNSAKRDSGSVDRLIHTDEFNSSVLDKYYDESSFEEAQAKVGKTKPAKTSGVDMNSIEQVLATYGDYVHVRLKDDDNFDVETEKKVTDTKNPSRVSPENAANLAIAEYTSKTGDYSPLKEIDDAENNFYKIKKKYDKAKDAANAEAERNAKDAKSIHELVKEFSEDYEYNNYKKDIEELKRIKDYSSKNSDVYHMAGNAGFIVNTDKVPKGYARLTPVLKALGISDDSIKKHLKNDTEYTKEELLADRKAHRKMQKNINKMMSNGNPLDSSPKEFEINPSEMDLTTRVNTINNLLTMAKQVKRKVFSGVETGPDGKIAMTSDNIVVEKEFIDMLTRYSRNNIKNNDGFIDKVKDITFEISDWNQFIQNFQLAGGASWFNALSIAQLRGAIFSDPLKMRQYISLVSDFKNSGAAAKFAIENKDFLVDMGMRTGDVSVFTDLKGALGARPGLEDGGSLQTTVTHMMEANRNRGLADRTMAEKYEFSKEYVQGAVDSAFSTATFRNMLPVLRAKMLRLNYDEAVKSLERRFPNLNQEDLHDVAMKASYAKTTAFFTPNKTSGGAFKQKSISDVLEDIHDEKLRNFVSGWTGAKDTPTLGQVASNCFFALGYKTSMLQRVTQGVKNLILPESIARKFRNIGSDYELKSGRIDTDVSLDDWGTMFMESGNSSQVGVLAFLGLIAWVNARSLGLPTAFDDLSFTDEKDGEPKIPDILNKFQTIGQIWIPNAVDENGNLIIDPNKTIYGVDTMSSIFTMSNTIFKTIDRTINPNAYYTAPQRGVGLLGQELGINPNNGFNDLLNKPLLRAVGDELIGSNLLSPYKAMYEVLVDSTYYGNNIWENKYLKDGSENPNYDPARNMKASVYHILGFDALLDGGKGYNDWVKGKGLETYKAQDQIGTVAGSGIFQHEYVTALISFAKGNMLEGAIEGGELPIKKQNLSSKARTEFNTEVKNILAQYMAEYKNKIKNVHDNDEIDEIYYDTTKKCADTVAAWSKKYDFVLGKNQELVASTTRIMMAILAGEYDDNLDYVQNAYWKASEIAQIESLGGKDYWLGDADLERYIAEGKTVEDFNRDKNTRVNAYNEALDNEYRARKAMDAVGIKNSYLEDFQEENMRSEQRAINKKVYNGVMNKLNSKVGEFDNFKEMKAYYEERIDAATTTKQKANLANKYNAYVKEVIAPYVAEYGASIISDGYYNNEYLSNSIADFIIIPADQYYNGKTPKASYLRDIFGVGYKNQSNVPSDDEVIEGYNNARTQITKGYNASAAAILERLITAIKKGQMYASDADYSRIVKMKAQLSARSI